MIPTAQELVELEEVLKEFRECVSEAQTEDLLADLYNLVKLEEFVKEFNKIARAELLKRHQNTGELKFENDHLSTMIKRAPLGRTWLKEQYGITADQIPDECYEEKVRKDVNWWKVEEWLATKDIPLDDRWTVQLVVKQ